MKVGFLDLLQSQFLMGVTLPNMNDVMLKQIPNVPNVVLANLPQQVHDFLAFVSVDELHTAYDDTAIVYSGQCRFDGSGSATPTPAFKSSNGSLLQVRDLGFGFRITIPRTASAQLRGAASVAAGGAGNGLTGNPLTDFTDFVQTLNAFDSAAGPSDFPNIDFRIELLFNTVSLHLPADTFIPATLNDNGWLEPDPDYTEVRIDLPKIGLTISQTADNYNMTQVRFAGWGINNFEEGGSAAAGEMIRMVPSLCLHSSGVVGFGLEKIVLDLSRDFTPPEILEKNFGIGDDFTGLWIPSVRLFVAPAGLSGLAVDTWAQDMLIDFNQGLSGEFGIELVNGGALAPLDVQTVCYQATEQRFPARQGADTVVTVNKKTSTQRSSRVALAIDGVLQLRIRGGKPKFDVVVKRRTDGMFSLQQVSASGTLFGAEPVPGHPNANQWRFDTGKAGDIQSVYIKVTDVNGNSFEEVIIVTLLEKLTATSTTVTTVKPPVLTVTNPDNVHSILIGANQPDNDSVLIYTTPGIPDVALKAGNTKVARNQDGSYRIPCKRGAPAVDFSASWDKDALPPQSAAFNPDAPIKTILHSHGQNFEYLYFGYDNPGGEKSSVPNPGHFAPDDDGYITAAADHYKANAANLNPHELPTSARLEAFVKNRGSRQIRVYGYASYEHHNDPQHAIYNKDLSDRRARTLIKILEGFDSTLKGDTSKLLYVSSTDAKGDIVAHAAAPATPQDKDYHVAICWYEPLQSGPVITINASVLRPPDEVITKVAPVAHAPIPHAPERPEFFRRIALKLRFQRNKLVLAEISGQFDFGKEAEVQTAVVVGKSNGKNGSVNPALNQNLVPSAGATETPDVEHKGMVDFRLSMVYNEATRKLTQTLELGFDKDNNRDGMLSLNRFKPYDNTNFGNTLKANIADTVASLLIFAPLLQAGVDAVQSAQSTPDRIAAMSMSIGEFSLATILGVTAIKMNRITLFGGSLSFSESSPDIWIGNASAPNEVGVMFDYGVQFGVNLKVGPLVIKTNETVTVDGNTKALGAPFVRYKAIGMKLNMAGGSPKLSPVFDTSKGYELSLGDPGALQIKIGNTDIGNLLKVLTARVARENPLVFEMDLALSINIGILTVDKIRVSAKINTDNNDGDQVRIMVIPTKVSVDIPGALIGVGYLDIGGDANVKGESDQVHDGFRGYVDLTLVPLKMRIAASLGIGPVSDGTRNATAFFLGLEVELPVAIPLGGTGIGIYGFLGLFGMHYKRMEKPDDPDQLPPALRWFDETVKGNVIDISGWQPALDSWSFGVGVILGTMEGGFVMNLKGMFMLELPGPRILIFVKAVMLFPKPKDVKGSNSAAGILAVIDLDFNLGKLTIGLIMQYEIESILSLRVPVDAEFNFNKPADWHVYIGSIMMPAEATILGIVRGYAFLMFSGDGIDHFPRYEDMDVLNGFSIAVGLGASMIFGDQEDGLYLEVAGDFKAGIGFSPLTIYGELSLRGELHLWIVSISAHAMITVKAASEKLKPGSTKSKFLTHLHGEACASVDLALFEVEGCVTIDIGSDPDETDPLDLVKGVTLVSRSNAVIQGQGVDRPIDGALGKAMELTAGIATDEAAKPPVVSIDAIIAIDMVAAPDVTGAVTFTEPLLKAPNAAFDYKVLGSDGKTSTQYKITKISLDQPLLDETEPRPASWWMQENDTNKGESGISLALLSWLPEATPHALHQSDILTNSLDHKWGTTCYDAAPPTAVLWTFNQKPLGYRAAGWTLSGTLWPDPPNTVRSTKPVTNVFVKEPAGLNIPFENKYRLLAKGTVLEHATVITAKGINPTNNTSYPVGRVLQFPIERAYYREKGVQPARGAVPDDLLNVFKGEETEHVFIECEATIGGNVLLAVDAAMVPIQNLVFRGLDSKNKILETNKATDFGFKQITSITDLPAHWRDPAGPWFKDISLVMAYLGIANASKEFLVYLIDYRPKSKPCRFTITAKPLAVMPTRKPVLLCALELTEAAEASRFIFDMQTQTSKQEILTKALQGDRRRALLRPGLTYNLSISYEYITWRNFLPVAQQTVDLIYQFKTESEAPKRLDPWVLATTPQHNMNVHYANDAVRIYFTDDSVFQLFKAYGHELKATLRKANGDHPDQTEAEMTITPGPDGKPAQSVTTEESVIKTAFNHAIDSATESMPCLPDTGHYKDQHIFTLPLPLLRNTSYTLEVESKTPIAPVNGQAYAPLYKIAFTTSRYLTVIEHAAAVRRAFITPRLLAAPLSPMAEIVPDVEMEQKLLDAGMDALEPAADPRVILLWAPAAGNTFVPAALIIDSPEPLWRQRPYATTEIVTDEAGNSMTHWVMKDKAELQILGNANVSSMARNVSGTRTIVNLKTAAAGQPFILGLKKFGFVMDPALYDTNGHTYTAELLNLTIPTLAPWVEND